MHPLDVGNSALQSWICTIMDFVFCVKTSYLLSNASAVPTSLIYFSCIFDAGILLSCFTQTDMQSWEEQSQGAIYSVEYACR